MDWIEVWGKRIERWGPIVISAYFLLAHGWAWGMVLSGLPLVGLPLHGVVRGVVVVGWLMGVLLWG